MIYNNLKKNKNNKVEIQNRVFFHFVRGPFVEIKGPKEANYLIKFIDNKTNKVHFTSEIKNNCWARCSIEYFVEWKIEIFENGKLWFEHSYDASNKRVYIALDSKALGDSLAWVPYVDEFRKKHKCKVVASTFMNDMFQTQYPEIEFVKPGTNVENLYSMHTIGLFYNEDNSVNIFKNPIDPKAVTLQQMCSDILGLEYTEIKPKLKKVKELPKEKQVCIGVFGTAQSKFWNNPTGWQEVVDWLNGRGYAVRLISKEGDDYMGNKLPNGIIHHPNGPIENVMEELKRSNAFIGIGSGLSWLSWALEVPTVLVSGFSYKWAEMQDCIRIGSPEGKCEGCFNRIRLNAGDWNWCPDHKGTHRQFECTKFITGQMVIKELEKFL
jgi:autotransporter strand-loop-strand O-heptosyltransferase